MPSSRAALKCWIDTSASVQCVAMRAIDAPASCAIRRSLTVPSPGSRRTAMRACCRLVDGGRDQLDVVDGAEAVVEARATEPVTVSDLDDLDPGAVQRVDDRAHLLLGEAVGHRMAAVAEGGVGDPDPRLRGRPAATASGMLVIVVHALAPTFFCAIRLPTRAAAAVMMSRLPGVGRQVVAVAEDLEEDRPPARARSRCREDRRTADRRAACSRARTPGPARPSRGLPRRSRRGRSRPGSSRTRCRA